MVPGRHGETPDDRGEPRAAPNAARDIQFGGPAVYRIVVQGVPGTDCSDRLAGLAITTTCRGDEAPHMILAGPLRDQAALSGLLDTLYGLHLPILKVEVVDEGAESHDRAT